MCQKIRQVTAVFRLLIIAQSLSDIFCSENPENRGQKIRLLIIAARTQRPLQYSGRDLAGEIAFDRPWF